MPAMPMTCSCPRCRRSRHCPASWNWPLTDLRGFSGQRAGVRTEIGLLLRQRAIHKVVALVDPDTDRALVDTLLDDKPRTAPGWALREVPRYSRWPWHDVRPEPLFEDLLAVAGR